MKSVYATCKTCVLHYCLLGLLGFLFPAVTQAGNPPDLASAFASDAGGWRSSTNTAVLNWEATGGTPDGYLRGSGAAGDETWFFVSPASWAGDWSGYQNLKFDFSIPSRHYPDAGQAGMVVVVGANGEEMTWTGSTPLWTWTHYEVTLSPAAFGVDATTYNGIMSDVAELRILAEYTTSTEIVGLDNVRVTATPPEAYQKDLVSRFTDGTTQGWRPVDDVTLSSDQLGWPSLGLKADDWMDGRFFKIATPTNWAGDWRGFRQLDFDMRWTGADDYHTNVTLVEIFGANGQTLTWSSSLTNGPWVHRTIPLQPETFGVNATEFEAVLAHVSEMWIYGEFGVDDDITYLDNVVLSTDTNGPAPLTQSLVSRFDAGNEGWAVYDNATLTWSNTNGISGGGLASADAGSGDARFQSPDDWAGDWRNFRALRFMVRVQANKRADFDSQIQIVTWSGSNLSLTLPKAFHSWTPYTVDLTPLTFGVTTNEFEAVMSDVACLWIVADLVNGTGSSDTTLLDNVMLLTQSGAGLPPDHWADFESGPQDWRYGGWSDTSDSWSFSGLAPHYIANGNPGGHLENTDTASWTYWFTPESWAGDWRGLQSASFDFKVIEGAVGDLFDTRMISLCSPWTNLHADVVTMPVPGEWDHYEFALTPATFGVSPEVFEQAMRDVVFLGIRSEWINGAEREGLDNFRLSKAPDAYWAWIGGYYSGSDLTDEDKTGKLADPDGDGEDNWSEYVAYTSPTNSSDRLRLELLAVTNGVCALQFHAATDRLYDLEYASDLSAPNPWSTLTNGVPGNGSAMEVLHPAGAEAQFFRLSVRLND